MVIKLSPEMAAVVGQDVARGGHGSAEEYVAEAIELMHEQEDSFARVIEEEQAKFEESLAEAYRGDVFTEEEIREYTRKSRAEWKLKNAVS